MYSFSSIFTKEPVVIASAVVGILNVLVLVGLVMWDAKVIAGINIALTLVLALFVKSTTVSTKKLEDLAVAMPPLVVAVPPPVPPVPPLLPPEV